MTSTVFQDYNQNTPIVSSWLNDVNKGTYSAGGIAKPALLTPAAWVRFVVSGGIVTIQQSSNIASVVRGGVGSFTITYGSPLTNSFNCYSINQDVAGFVTYGFETNSSVLVSTYNVSNVIADPDLCSVVIWGAN